MRRRRIRELRFKVAQAQFPASEKRQSGSVFGWCGLKLRLPLQRECDSQQAHSANPGLAADIIRVSATATFVTPRMAPRWRLAEFRRGRPHRHAEQRLSPSRVPFSTSAPCSRTTPHSFLPARVHPRPFFISR